MPSSKGLERYSKEFHKLDVLESIYEGCPTAKDMAYFEADACVTVFGHRRAKAMLGWEPKFDWRDFEDWEL